MIWGSLNTVVERWIHLYYIIIITFYHMILQMNMYIILKKIKILFYYTELSSSINRNGQIYFFWLYFNGCMLVMMFIIETLAQ